VTDFARTILDTFHLDYATFSQQALWAAGQSQQPTAIPALVAIASLSLLAVVLWVGALAWFLRRVYR
jgi:hypothetical protein